MIDAIDHAPNCPLCSGPMQKAVITRLPLTQSRVDNTNTFFAWFCPACGQVLHRADFPVYLYAFFFDDTPPYKAVRP